MTKGLLNKKIPSLLGIAIIAAGITATTFLVKGDQILQTNAGSGNNPENIEVSNLSDTAFTVTYTTDNKVLGTLNVGTSIDKLDQNFLDDRDKISQTINNYQTHFFTVNNLKPNTTYFYSINFGKEKTSNNESPYSIKTGPSIGQPNPFDKTVSGKAINPDGSIPTDGIAFIKLGNTNTLSTLLNKDGSYNISTKNLRSNDLNSYLNLPNDSVIKLIIRAGNYNSEVSLSGSQTNQIPLITLSNNYDFIETESNSASSSSTKDVKFPDFKPNLKNKNIKSPVSISPTNLPTQ